MLGGGVTALNLQLVQYLSFHPWTTKLPPTACWDWNQINTPIDTVQIRFLRTSHNPHNIRFLSIWN